MVDGARLRRSDVVVDYRVGSKQVLVNDQVLPMGLAAQIRAARIFVPLRSAARILGASVSWSQTRKQVLIKMPDLLRPPAPVPHSFTENKYFNLNGVVLRPLPSRPRYEDLNFEVLSDSGVRLPVILWANSPGLLPKGTRVRISGVRYGSEFFGHYVHILNAKPKN